MRFYSAPAPLSDSDTVAEVNQAINDKVNLINISYGQCENDAFGGYDNPLASLFAQASSLDIVVASSSGDYGYGGCDNKRGDGQAQAPAADNNDTAVGGLDVGSNGFVNPIGWQNSGGHDSVHYGKKSWQDGVTPGKNRDVPDIAMPATQYALYYNSGWIVSGGTSLAAPLWIAAQAELNQQEGNNHGNVAPDLYNIYDNYAYGNHSPPYFVDIVSGNNGMACTAGWDYVTGIGAPNIEGLARANS